MASTSHQKGRDGVLSTLDVFIQVLNIAKDTCGTAQITFGSASVLLTMIWVHLPRLCENRLPAHGYLGYDGQRSGLHRPWAGLR
jgi:hypothetical protein